MSTYHLIQTLFLLCLCFPNIVPVNSLISLSFVFPFPFPVSIPVSSTYKYSHGGKYPHHEDSGINFPGMNTTKTVAKQWYPTIVGMYVKKDQSTVEEKEKEEAVLSDIVLETIMPNGPSELGYGAPTKVWIKYSSTSTSGTGAEVKTKTPLMNVEVVWEGKRPSRLCESIWLEVRPDLPNSLPKNDDGTQQWKLYVDKIGQRVDTADVVANGGGALHGIDPNGGVSLVANGASSATAGLYVSSLDAGLVAPGSNTNIWNYTAYDKVPVNPSDGFAFDLYSNLYATNYPMWYPWRKENGFSRFRFQLMEL